MMKNIPIDTRQYNDENKKDKPLSIKLHRKLKI
jgi:hypothetical protein